MRRVLSARHPFRFSDRALRNCRLLRPDVFIPFMECVFAHDRHLTSLAYKKRKKKKQKRTVIFWVRRAIGIGLTALFTVLLSLVIYFIIIWLHER